MHCMLACDFDENKLKFPYLALPKIDGVRALVQNGVLVARSLKPIRNHFTREFFSKPYFEGFDGELAANSEVHPDLCRMTTSATSSYDGEPYCLWWLFDYYTDETKHLSYKERHDALRHKVEELKSEGKEGAARLRVVPIERIETHEQLSTLESLMLEAGYEGVILRDPDGKYKEGRATLRENAFLRIKRFAESEATVVSIIEGETNENEAQVNELGYQYRTSHAENMVPNGMVGAMLCRALQTVKDGSRIVIEKGQEFTVSAGSMPHNLRLHYFQNPDLLLNKIITYKFFPKGIKDKPRFPTYVTIRHPDNM